MAVKFGLIEINHFPHVSGQTAAFSEQFRICLGYFLQEKALNLLKRQHIPLAFEFNPYILFGYMFEIEIYQ